MSIDNQNDLSPRESPSTLRLFSWILILSLDIHGDRYTQISVHAYIVVQTDIYIYMYINIHTSTCITEIQTVPGCSESGEPMCRHSLEAQIQPSTGARPWTADEHIAGGALNLLQSWGGGNSMDFGVETCD